MFHPFQPMVARTPPQDPSCILYSLLTPATSTTTTPLCQQQASPTYFTYDCTPSPSTVSSGHSPSAPSLLDQDTEARRNLELQQQFVSKLLREAVLGYCEASGVLKQEKKSPCSGVAKPHKCDECGKTFRFHSNLVEHRTVHFEGVDHMFPCPVCPKKCRLKGNLKKHLHRHYSSQAEVDQAWFDLYGGHTRRRMARDDVEA